MASGKRKWKGCQAEGCINPGTVRYTREERGPDKSGIKSRRRLYVCGEHDFALRKAWRDLMGIMALKYPEKAAPGEGSLCRLCQETPGLKGYDCDPKCPLAVEAGA